MNLTPLPDGTYRMTDLKFGDPNKRYWKYDERGAIVWEAHPDVVTVPDNVSVIGWLHCPILGEIVLPPSVSKLEDLAFSAEFFSGDTYEWYALHTVHFSQGLKSIGYRAFYSCRELDGVRLPKGLVEIEEDAFYICHSLSRITIPGSVEYIGKRAFGKCTSLEKVIFHNGIRRIGGSVFAEDTRLRDVILPESLERIGDSAFLGCSSLADIDIPDGLEEIGGNAFCDCVSLSSFHFKRDLKNAEELHRRTPFSGCSSLRAFYLDKAVTRADWLPSAPMLEEFKIPADHPHFVTVGGVLYSKDKKTLLRVPTARAGEFTVPRGVNAIAPSAFRGCDGITEVILPSTLLTVGNNAFAGCKSLRSIDLPNKLTEVGGGAFSNCSALTRVHISGSVRRVGTDAFDGCTALSEITVSPQNRFYLAQGKKLIPLSE